MIALQTNGEILVFSLLCPNGQLMYKSEPYTVVMYKVRQTHPKINPYPSWTFRTRVGFSGTWCSAPASPPGISATLRREPCPGIATIWHQRLTMTSFSRGLLDSNYGPHTYVYMSDRWDAMNGTGYWMVGPVDDLSDESFLEDAARSYDMDQVVQYDVSLLR